MELRIETMHDYAMFMSLFLLFVTCVTLLSLILPATFRLIAARRRTRL